MNLSRRVVLLAFWAASLFLTMWGSYFRRYMTAYAKSSKLEVELGNALSRFLANLGDSWRCVSENIVIYSYPSWAMSLWKMISRIFYIDHSLMRIWTLSVILTFAEASCLIPLFYVSKVYKIDEYNSKQISMNFKDT